MHYLTFWILIWMLIWTVAWKNSWLRFEHFLSHSKSNLNSNFNSKLVSDFEYGLNSNLALMNSNLTLISLLSPWSIKTIKEASLQLARSCLTGGSKGQEKMRPLDVIRKNEHLDILTKMHLNVKHYTRNEVNMNVNVSLILNS